MCVDDIEPFIASFPPAECGCLGCASTLKKQRGIILHDNTSWKGKRPNKIGKKSSRKGFPRAKKGFFFLVENLSYRRLELSPA
jgi:hypothetical protein